MLVAASFHFTEIDGWLLARLNCDRSCAIPRTTSRIE
jgi:hypothetical protein